MNETEKVHFTSAELERMKVQGQAVIPAGILESARFDVRKDEAGRLMMRLSAYVWTQNVDEVSVQYPATWKEAVKEHWLPRLYRSRWIPHFIWRWIRGKPVQYTRVALRAKRVYPDIVVPDQRYSVHLLKEYETKGER